MITLLSKKNVKIRKGRNCFGCGKYYSHGNQMHVRNFACEEGIYSLYHCITCGELLDRHFKVISGGETEVEEFCVGDLLQSGFVIPKTKEQLLEMLDKGETIWNK